MRIKRMGCGIFHVADNQILLAPRARQVIPTRRAPNPAARDREYFEGVRDYLRRVVNMEMQEIEQQRQRESRAQRCWEKIADSSQPKTVVSKKKMSSMS